MTVIDVNYCTDFGNSIIAPRREGQCPSSTEYVFKILLKGE